VLVLKGVCVGVKRKGEPESRTRTKDAGWQHKLVICAKCILGWDTVDCTVIL
jgi:hypothetical protein